MRRFFLLFLIAAVVSCAKPPIKHDVKTQPQHSTEITDPEVKLITDEFFRLSAQNDIVFTNKVSIGFNNIDRGNVVGTCSYTPNFREIDLDREFWDRSTWLSKIALVYHELSHCYCERDHDFDDGTMYPDNSLKSILQNFFANQPLTPLRPAGFLDDGCPKSIMHPIMVGDYCFKTHYQHYTQEMFARCEPW